VLFLLKIRTQLPGDWSAEQTADMLDRQFATGVALMRRRVIQRMFRGVGQLANFSIWEAPWRAIVSLTASAALDV